MTSISGVTSGKSSVKHYYFYSIFGSFSAWSCFYSTVVCFERWTCTAEARPLTMSFTDSMNGYGTFESVLSGSLLYSLLIDSKLISSLLLICDSNMFSSLLIFIFKVSKLAKSWLTLPVNRASSWLDWLCSYTARVTSLSHTATFFKTRDSL